MLVRFIKGWRYFPVGSCIAIGVSAGRSRDLPDDIARLAIERGCAVEVRKAIEAAPENKMLGVGENK